MPERLENNSNKYARWKIGYIIIISVAALGLALRPIPWAVDDVGYLNYATYSDVLLSTTWRMSAENKFYFLVNEPLWLLINSGLRLFFEKELVVRLIIFISAAGAFWALGKLSNYSILLVLLFLCIPQSIKNYVSHLRQGLALSFFLIGLAVDGCGGFFLRLLAPFVHTSFWFISIFELFDTLFKKLKVSLNIRVTMFPLFSLGLIWLIPSLVLFFGDRREYTFIMSEEASGFGFIWWAILGILFVLCADKSRPSVLACYGIIFYLVTYFFIDFGARIFENLFPLVLLSMVMSKKDLKPIYGVSMAVYAVIQWYLKKGFVF